MLDDALVGQLTTHLTNIRTPIELVATTDDSANSTQLVELLNQIAATSEQVTARFDGTGQRTPSFIISRIDSETSVEFAGLPLGHEFTSLVLALLHVGGHPGKASDELVAQIQSLEGTYAFETFFSLTCRSCPDVVQALNLMSVLNPNITHTAIDGALFQDEVEERKILAVPMIFLNGEKFDQGRMTLEQIVNKLDTASADRMVDTLNGKETFDVLVVGGGPAGASAAIYAARKGINTGVVAERFGGQVLDTMSIENLVSVPKTDGPKLASALETHVLEYDVDLMDLQRAESLSRSDSGEITVGLANGAQLTSRSVILSTGARWRHLNVPGENEYLNKGVAYCPHCDGPLFKGKPVAVVGGGNSGIEAAIDLAGITSHVTVLEFADALLADDVLQRKLYSLPNVTVILSAATTEVLGDGEQVTGLTYTDRTTDESHQVDLNGIFVQIGLLPNTEWLEGAIDLSPRGEIVIDDRGQTSMPGVFAAGDATTVPYKQIVIAMGAGSTAALSAFDHLIRTSAPA